MTFKVYIGTPRVGAGPHIVTVIDRDGGRALDPRHDLANHSPDGFQWGYSGSGPAQLSLAICANALGDDARAVAIYQRFKFATVATWPQGKPWTMLGRQVVEIVEQLEQQKRKQRGDA